MERPIRGGSFPRAASGSDPAADAGRRVLRRDGNGHPEALSRSANVAPREIIDGPVIGRDIFVPATQTKGRKRTVGERRPWRPARIIGLVVSGLVLAALMNADHLVDRADKKPFGGGRDFWLAVWEPVQTVSDALYLNRPRQWLDEALDRELTSKTFQFDSTTEPPPAATSDAAEAAGGGTPAPTVDGTGVTGSATPAATPTPTAPPPRLRQPTADNPLEMYIAGDSMATAFGASLSRLASATGLITPDLDAHAATGLSRPDFFDWPGELHSKVEEDAPDVVVIIFGANDSQGLKTEAGEIFQPLSDGWRAEYRRRVAGTMDLMKAPGRIVIWVGQPVMVDADFSARMADINTIYREEAEKRPWVEFFDSWPLFVDGDGNYNPYLTDENGLEQLMRASDGIHLTRMGADRLASAVLRRLNEDVTIFAP